MQHQILIRKTLGLPYPEQRVCIQFLLIDLQGNIFGFAAFAVVLTNIIRQPAHDTPAFIIISARTLSREITAALEAVHKEIPYIIATLIYVFDQFLKIRHTLILSSSQLF